MRAIRRAATGTPKTRLPTDASTGAQPHEAAFATMPVLEEETNQIEMPPPGDAGAAARASVEAHAAAAPQVRSEVNSELNFSPNFEGLVLGCIDADFCK